MRAWVGLFLSGHNKGALSVSRGRSPGRKGREDVAWVLCWETGASSCLDSPLWDGVQTSCINRAYCWNQEGTLNARGEEGSDAFLPPRCGIQEAVSPGRRWHVACGVRHGGASFWEKSSVHFSHYRGSLLDIPQVSGGTEPVQHSQNSPDCICPATTCLGPCRCPVVCVLCQGLEGSKDQACCSQYLCLPASHICSKMVLHLRSYMQTAHTFPPDL